MILKHTHTFIRMLLFCVLLGCSSSGDDAPPTLPTPVEPPQAAVLVFPLENSECTEGSNFTSTQSDVPFDWSDAVNAVSYKLFVKNLNTQVTNQYTSANSQLSVTLSRATPYSWYVVSENENAATAQSSTWKFYNAGTSQSSYAPFPAELIAPAMGAALNASITSVNLEWSGSDVDNDIENYTVLFGTTATPSTVLAQNLSATQVSATVVSSTTYYWRVITNDSNGNNSESEIFQFKID